MSHAVAQQQYGILDAIGRFNEPIINTLEILSVVSTVGSVRAFFISQGTKSATRSVISRGVVNGQKIVAARGSTATTWNGFQKMTAGQFATRAEAGAAWSAYKQANGIVTGAVRSQAQKSLFLRNAANSGMYPKYMNQWLRNGKVPPGYHVDHIKPLSIGGRDVPLNMRLLDIDFHINIHHKYYRPWQ